MTVRPLTQEEVLAALNQTPELWLSDNKELALISAMLVGENMRRALELIDKLGFAVVRKADIT